MNRGLQMGAERGKIKRRIGSRWTGGAGDMKSGGKLRRYFKSRILWSVLGIGFLVYLGSGLLGYDFLWRNRYFFDVVSPVLFLFAPALVLYISGMEKDFCQGVRRAFSRKGKGASRMELQRAVKAFGCAEKAMLVTGVIVSGAGFMDQGANMVFSNSSNEVINLTVAGLVMGIISGQVMCCALFILVLIPIKMRLERMVISYMEEPEDSGAEEAEADEQKIYFRLRGLGLTDREAEVARLAGGGLSNREIGQQLFIAEGTVKKHMTHILEKSGCCDRDALRERIREISRAELPGIQR